jgi:hypothetical protein
MSKVSLAATLKPRIEEPIIPGRKEGEKFVYFVRDLLSKEECKEWITYAETIGFQPASLVPASTDEKTSPSVIKNPHRSNDRVLLFDTKRASLLTERLKSLGVLPLVWHSKNEHKEKLNADKDKVQWQLVGLNERLSFLRYAVSERYGRHVDVPYEDSEKGIRSFITVQLYLNSEFAGGETRFDQEVGYKDFHSHGHLDVVPETGSALLFEHELTHEGCAVTEGVKYTVRIDVLYQCVKKES